jgi:hypothetical protein
MGDDAGGMGGAVVARTSSNNSVGFTEGTNFDNSELSPYVGAGADAGDDARYSRRAYTLLGLVPAAVMGMSPRPRNGRIEKPTGEAYLDAATDEPANAAPLELEDDPMVPNGHSSKQQPLSNITTSAAATRAIDAMSRRIKTAKEELGVEGHNTDSIRARTAKLQHDKQDVVNSKLVSDAFIKELVYQFEDQESVDFLIQLLQEMRWEFFERPLEVAELWNTVRDSEMKIGMLRQHRDDIAATEKRKKATEKKEKLKRQLERAEQEEKMLGAGGSSGEQLVNSTDEDEDDDGEPKSRLRRTPLKKQKKSVYKQDSSDEEWDGEGKGKGKAKRRRR